MLSRKYTYAQDITPFADENVDDLGDVSDEFSELFFEALKQKGIENYERAITALDQCIVMEPKRAILYFERGKNEAALKQYEKAEISFKKSLELTPDQIDVYEALLDSYEQAKDYEQAIATGLKLVTLDPVYREDLARVYISNRSFKEGLDLLDQLDREKGKDSMRDYLRKRAFRFAGNTYVKEYLQNKVTQSQVSKTELEQLIGIYIAENNAGAAQTTVQQLKVLDPQNPIAAIGEYKTLLTQERYDEAIERMQLAFSSQLPVTSKKVILEDYIRLVKDLPQYQADFESSIATIGENKIETSLHRRVSAYYRNKGKAGAGELSFLEKALATDPENLELILKVAQAQLTASKFEAAKNTTDAGLELFPSQPQLYLNNAKALNGLGNYDRAIESLELGIDYIIDNTDLEAQYYEVWAQAYQGKGDQTNYNKYLQRARAKRPQG